MDWGRVGKLRVNRIVGNGAGGTRRKSMFDYTKDISLGVGEGNVQ